MKEFIEKLISRLEEESRFAVSLLGGKTSSYIAGCCDTNKKTISIVSQLAEEHKGGWMEELLEAKKNCSEDSDCSKCPFGQIKDRCILAELQIEGGNNGWIPCSERLPEEPRKIIAEIEDVLDLINANVLTEYNVTLQGAKLPTSMYYAGNGFWFDEASKEFYPVIAWQPLPEVYQPLAAVTKED